MTSVWPGGGGQYNKPISPQPNAIRVSLTRLAQEGQCINGQSQAGGCRPAQHAELPEQALLLPQLQAAGSGIHVLHHDRGVPSHLGGGPAGLGAPWE